MADIEDILEELGDDLELLELFEADDATIKGVAVDGARASTLWDAFRRRDTGYWPLILGIERDVEGHRQAAGLRRLSVERLASRARVTLNHLDEMHLQEALEQVGHAQHLADASGPFTDTPPLPDDAVPGASELALEVPVNLATGSAYDRVFVGLVPTTRPWMCPLFLNFGGWNDCPPPEAHAAQLACWARDWGAELVTLSDTTMELRVARRPDSWKDAFDLASAQADYCPELVSRGSWNLRTLAESLTENSLWRFWWS
jgi:hypothetical protein